MATDNIKKFDDFLDRMQELIYETRKQFAMEDEKPFDYENATIVQKDFAPIKPKFKEGDWIVFNEHIFYIKEVACGFYKTISKDDIAYNYDWCIDKMARLWTVEDAREGDVLVDYCDEYENPLIFILKKFEHVDFGLVIPSDYSSYCFLTMGDRPRFKEGDFHHMHDVKPATEEQRETLMKAMAEAGYTFDFDKKELKKVEEKPSDKIEPKFHKGDWIISHYNHIAYIKSIGEKDYFLTCSDGNSERLSIDCINRNCYLWTIQDAKDGDVLVGREDDVILMFRGIGNAEWDNVIDYHCYYDCYQEDFIVQEDLNYWGNTENSQLKPATKEQRDLLLSKMKEAGYEWDAEEKQLYKSEQKTPEESLGIDSETYNKVVDECIYGEQEVEPKWTDEDKENISALIDLVESKEESMEVKIELSTWLKALKERVKLQPKPEWSEEDKKIIGNIRKIIAQDAFYNSAVDVNGELCEKMYIDADNWLKSLKDRVLKIE